MDHSMPRELEERISYYERSENDPGSLTSAEWSFLVATGILLPIVSLVVGWFIGWPS